jgi:EmrB/QacA subfamily drug resistance transporter
MTTELNGRTVKSTEDLHRGTIVMVLVVGAFVAILNQTLLNVAIPHLMTAFNASADTIQWLSTGYMLANGVVIPLTAYLIARFTTRQLFITAMILFTVGSFVCSIATGFPMMLVGRVIQASGAGIMMPLMMTVILNIYPPEVRGKAMGTIGVPMFFAPAVGPTLSGWMIEHWSWRLLFYVVIPIAILDIILAFVFLRNVTETTKPKFDFAGVVTSTIGFGSLLYGFSEAGNKGWGDAIVLGSIVLGIVFIILFVVIELTSKRPMLNLRVFKVGMFSLSAAVSSIVNMAMFGGALLVPIYVQNIRGYSPLESGMLMLPGALLMGAMSPVSGALLDRIGIRPLAVVGLLITALTTWQFAQLNMQTTYHHIMVLYTWRMFGMSFIAMTIMTSGLNHLPRHLNSHGTSSANTVRMVAASLGTAFLVTIMTNRSTLHLSQYQNTMSLTNPTLHLYINQFGAQIGQMLGQSAQVGQTVATDLLYSQAVQLSTVKGINDAFMVATGLTVLALILSLFMRNINKRSVSDKVSRRPEPADSDVKFLEGGK